MTTAHEHSLHSNIGEYPILPCKTNFKLAPAHKLLFSPLHGKYRYFPQKNYGHILIQLVYCILHCAASYHRFHSMLSLAASFHDTFTKAQKKLFIFLVHCIFDTMIWSFPVFMLYMNSMRSYCALRMTCTVDH